MSETYGAMKDMPVATLYREAMDQFAKGINVMVPHAVWTNPADITFPPELSSRTAPYAAALPAYNQYIGRLQRILQQGVPAADIAVLYPIAGLQAGYHFGEGKPYEGGVIPPEADYMDVGERLSLGLRRDFTFLHPEVLTASCRVEDGVLRLVHPDWSQAFTTVIVPGGVAIRADNLRTIKEFYDRGGRVIFTTRLPERSAEPGKDEEVKALLEAMLGGGRRAAARASGPGRISAPIPRPAALARRWMRGRAAPDVDWQGAGQGEGRESIVSSQSDRGAGRLFLRQLERRCGRDHGPPAGPLRGLETWDPHTGGIAKLKTRRITDRGRDGHGIRAVASARPLGLHRGPGAVKRFSPPGAPASVHVLAQGPAQVLARDAQELAAPQPVALGAGLQVGDVPGQDLFPQADHLVVVPDLPDGGVLDVAQRVIAEEVLGAGQDRAVPEDDQGVPEEGAGRVGGLGRRLADVAGPVVQLLDVELVEGQAFETVQEGLLGALSYFLKTSGKWMSSMKVTGFLAPISFLISRKRMMLPIVFSKSALTRIDS